jgi:hypothetical protein
MARNLLVDVSDAASHALNFIFMEPFKIMWIISRWLLKQCLLLFKDIFSLFSIVPTIGRIALRLASACALVYWVGPVLLLFCVVFPINRLSQWIKKLKHKEEPRAQPPPGYEDWIKEQFRQRMAEMRAEEERRHEENRNTNSGGRGRGKRNGRRGRRN